MTTSLVFDKLNQDTRVSWPNEEWKMRGGKNKWGRWRPKNGMEGVIVHAWLPRHRETVRRSPIDFFSPQRTNWLYARLDSRRIAT